MNNKKYPHQGMIKVSDWIYKTVIVEGNGGVLGAELQIKKVVFDYKTFFGNLNNQIVSNVMKIIDVSMGIEELPGYMQALATMKDQEKALFWISHQLLGDFRHDGVIFKAKIRSVEASKGAQIDEKGFNITFNTILTNAKVDYYVAGDHFKRKEFGLAIDTLMHWTTELEIIKLDNKLQVLDRRILLAKFYRNLSICYLKADDALTSLTMIEKLGQISSIQVNPVALYAQGKALMMLNDFTPSLKCLKAAEALVPYDDVVKQALIEWESAVEVHKYELSKNDLETLKVTTTVEKVTLNDDNGVPLMSFYKPMPKSGYTQSQKICQKNVDDVF